MRAQPNFYPDALRNPGQVETPRSGLEVRFGVHRPTCACGGGVGFLLVCVAVCLRDARRRAWLTVVGCELLGQAPKCNVIVCVIDDAQIASLATVCQKSAVTCGFV